MCVVVLKAVATQTFVRFVLDIHKADLSYEPKVAGKVNVPGNMSFTVTQDSTMALWEISICVNMQGECV